MTIAERYKAWRHSRGFGIHSPFAYRLVKDALHPPILYAYYADFSDEIDLRCGERSPIHPSRLLRLALFLRSHLNISTACIEGKYPNALRFALKSAGLKVSKSPMKSDFLILLNNENGRHTPLLDELNKLDKDGDVYKNIIANIISPGYAILIDNTTANVSELIDALGSALENSGHGLMIKARKYTLLIANPSMSFTEYSIL